MEQQSRDRIAQWAFDTRSILDRFHLWLEDVEEELSVGEGADSTSFVGDRLERALVMGAAVTALGTRLYGGWGAGAGKDKQGLNRAKKDADAVSAYALSEALWYLTRALPENHAIMVSLGEGLMPKAGETPEMGSNPLLGFGRVYARPEVAQFVDAGIHQMLNRPGYGWEQFWADLNGRGVTVWGAAIDTLENTSRFAKGDETGPMTVLHLYDQPLAVAAPYEGYVGCLVVPEAVARAAAAQSVLLDYHAPRAKVMAAIRRAYPDVAPEHVHVWTLGGASREARIGSLWQEWREAGAHIVDSGWTIPGGGECFTESGTYAPVYRVGRFEADGAAHVFVCDGYAASAEAIQAASLDPIFSTHSALCMFSSHFDLPVAREREVMALDPESETFDADLATIADGDLDQTAIDAYRSSMRDARTANMPSAGRAQTIDDFFPRKSWRVLAVAGRMLPDPYTNDPGVEEIAPSTYRVTVRSATRQRHRRIELTLRLREDDATSRLVFSPLLDRFCAGEDYRRRPVKISDSGRIRNELQTLCSDALDHFDGDGIRVHFDRIDDAVLPAARKKVIRDVLNWYKANHPVWFHWLELAS